MPSVLRVSEKPAYSFHGYVLEQIVSSPAWAGEFRCDGSFHHSRRPISPKSVPSVLRVSEKPAYSFHGYVL
ncbi:MAG: hypothetical protein KDA77_21685, partial [Planctomycetaceae bacterium]|nr:hypothetical protein [Planctomycetaceae bacterium]